MNSNLVSPKITYPLPEDKTSALVKISGRGEEA